MKGILLILFTCVSILFSCQSKKEEVSDQLVASETTGTSTGTASIAVGIPLLIGTYTQDLGWVNGKAKGIHLAVLKEGKVELVNTIDVGHNPSYIAIHPNKKYFYVVNELADSDEEESGQIGTYSIDQSGNIQLIHTRSSRGSGPCHISINEHGTQLLVAHYGSGNISSFPIGLDGALGRDNATIQFTGKGSHDRQEAPHAHFIKEGPDRKIYATDLGTDSIRVYNLVGGALERTGDFKVENEGGPRHLSFHGALPIVYVLNELSGSIEAWQEVGESKYQRIQSISTLSPSDKGKFAHSGAIKINADNRFLYASNRGDINTIASFQIAEGGELNYLGEVSTMGKIPRDMAIDPSGRYLIIANQDSDNIFTYEIDAATGALSNPKNSPGIMTPSCIAFL